MVKKVVAFVDGENLVFRFQAMKAAGSSPRADVLHIPDSFVWSPRVTAWTHMDLIRVSYYTSVVGDHPRVAEVERAIAATTFRCEAANFIGEAHLIPRVHKKAADSRKTKVIDIDLTMDVMRAALRMPVDGIYLLSGDGDYLPLLREITRTTSKQVHVGAFSSGLDAALRSCAENFVDFDDLFFESSDRG
jgi:uncharacterized LabA/DUF88 family protein